MAGERAEARPGRRTGTCALACWPLLGLFALAQTWSLACRAAAAQNLRAAQARREARHALLEAGVVQRPGGFEDPVPLRHVDSRAAAAVWVAGLSFLLPAMLLLCVQCLERTRTAIGASVLAHFALRGACLAAPAALLAQGLAQSTAKRIAAAPAAPAAPSPAAWLVTALLAAVTEELAKLLALLLCTDVFLAGAVAGGAPDEEADGPSTACRTEVASPQALTLAGVAVGLGFLGRPSVRCGRGSSWWRDWAAYLNLGNGASTHLVQLALDSRGDQRFSSGSLHCSTLERCGRLLGLAWGRRGGRMASSLLPRYLGLHDPSRRTPGRPARPRSLRTIGNLHHVRLGRLLRVLAHVVMANVASNMHWS